MLSCPGSRLAIWSRETGSAVPSRVSLLISILRLNLVFTYGMPSDVGNRILVLNESGYILHSVLVRAEFVTYVLRFVMNKNCCAMMMQSAFGQQKYRTEGLNSPPRYHGAVYIHASGVDAYGGMPSCRCHTCEFSPRSRSVERLPRTKG